MVRTCRSLKAMHLTACLLAGLASLAHSQRPHMDCLDVSRNGICLGLVPDEADAGGTAHTIAAVNAAVAPRRWSVIGWYAQARPGVPFDGSQITRLIPDLVTSKATFEAAVMPTGASLRLLRLLTIRRLCRLHRS